MEIVTPVDNQPIASDFFREGKWLTEYITPNAFEVQLLYEDLCGDLGDVEEKIHVLHQWVGNQIRYVKFVRGRMEIEGKLSVQNDLWNSPSVTRRVGVGNCANKSFLLASLIRNALPASNVKCVLGNLYNGKPGGHAWVQVNLGGIDYIVESTRADIPTFVPADGAERYEAVHKFDDNSVYTIEGRTVMVPYTACYSSWLRDYLDWSYINGGK